MKAKSDNFDSAAFDVCLKLRSHPGYASYDAAIASLRRRCRGLNATDADRLIQHAQSVFDAAVGFMSRHTEHLLAVFQATGVVRPEDVQPFEPAFVSQCPSASPILARRALWSAALRHLR
jgi:hypothetical protein